MAKRAKKGRRLPPPETVTVKVVKQPEKPPETATVTIVKQPEKPPETATVTVRMGRPPGPPEKVRRKKVFVLLTDSEFEKLTRLADERGVPRGTLLYEIVARALRRRK